MINAMARTSRAAELQRQNKRRRGQEARDTSWQKWRECGLCGSQYCANNYADRKTRIAKWRGVEVCAHCKHTVIKMMPRLEELKVVKTPKKWRK